MGIPLRVETGARGAARGRRLPDPREEYALRDPGLTTEELAALHLAASPCRSRACPPPRASSSWAAWSPRARVRRRSRAARGAAARRTQPGPPVRRGGQPRSRCASPTATRSAPSTRTASSSSGAAGTSPASTTSGARSGTTGSTASRARPRRCPDGPASSARHAVPGASATRGSSARASRSRPACASTGPGALGGAARRPRPRRGGAADGSVVVELPVTNRAAFRSFVLSFLEHAEILDPPELRDDLVAWLVSGVTSAPANVTAGRRRGRRMRPRARCCDGAVDRGPRRSDPRRGVRAVRRSREKELAADLEVMWLVGLPPYTPDALIDVVQEGDRVWIHFADVFDAPQRLTPDQARRAAHRRRVGLARAAGHRPDGPLGRGVAKLAAVLGVEPTRCSTSTSGRRRPTSSTCSARPWPSTAASPRLLLLRARRADRARRRPVPGARRRQPLRARALPPGAGRAPLPGRPHRRRRPPRRARSSRRPDRGRHAGRPPAGRPAGRARARARGPWVAEAYPVEDVRDRDGAAPRPPGRRGEAVVRAAARRPRAEARVVEADARATRTPGAAPRAASSTATVVRSGVTLNGGRGPGACRRSQAVTSTSPCATCPPPLVSPATASTATPTRSPGRCGPSHPDRGLVTWPRPPPMAAGRAPVRPTTGPTNEVQRHG